MNKVEKLYDEVLTESGLSRIWQHIQNYDCAMITAFRNKDVDCIRYRPDNSDQEIPYKEKLRRNRELHAILLGMGSGVTKVSGAFIEGFGTNNEKAVTENSFFVVNLKNDPNFFKKIVELGERYCQDSVLLKPKNSEKAYLYGTNNSDFPGLGEKYEVGIFKGGERSEFMTNIKGRPFIFDSSDFNAQTRGIIFSREYAKFLEEVNINE